MSRPYSTIPTLTPDQQSHLERMIEANQTTDQTGLIRSLKHSDLIRDQLSKLYDILTRHRLDSATSGKDLDTNAIRMEAMVDCELICNGYPTIYTLMVADRVDMEDLDNMLKTLKEIEEGRMSQHIASFKAGQSLTDRYTQRISASASASTSTTNDSNANLESDTTEGYRTASEEMEGLTWSAWKSIAVAPTPAPTPAPTLHK